MIYIGTKYDIYLERFSPNDKTPTMKAEYIYHKTVQGQWARWYYHIQWDIHWHFKHTKFRQDLHVIYRTMLCYKVGVCGKREKIRWKQEDNALGEIKLDLVVVLRLSFLVNIRWYWYQTDPFTSFRDMAFGLNPTWVQMKRNPKESIRKYFQVIGIIPTLH